VKGFIGCAGALANYDLRPGLPGISASTLLILPSVTIPRRALHRPVKPARLRMSTNRKHGTAASLLKSLFGT